MAYLNKVFILGNLTANPKLRQISSGSVCDINVAVNNKQQNSTCFFDVSAFGKIGENINKYLKKGSPILIEGRLQQDTWRDAETHEKHTKIKIIAENAQFLVSSTPVSQSNSFYSASCANNQPETLSENPEVQNLQDQDIPF